MLILFISTALVVSWLNQLNLQLLYEKNFTERVLLSNKLIATLIDEEDVRYYVDFLTDQDREFKNKQIQFYHDREELFRLQEKQASAEEQAFYLNRMKSFHNEMDSLKSDLYWIVVKNLKQLRDVSNSKYVYIIADTGVMTEDGEILYTYIFDADDDDLYDEPDNDGLGTVNTGEDVIKEIYKTKESMDSVMYYNGSYGELYFAYAPVLDSDGNVIAILGTDVALDEMHIEIKKSMFLFNMVFLSFGIIIILLIYLFVRRYITKPLGELTATAKELADGDAYTFVPYSALKQRSELGVLAHAIEDMSNVYKSMIKSIEEMGRATRIGKLEVRNDSSKYKGDIKKVVEQINDTLDAMTLYLNGVPEGIFIMSRKFEMYFRNERYTRFFGSMKALEFVKTMFPEASEQGPEALEKQVAELLGKPDNITLMWMNGLCFSVAFKEIVLSEAGENSVLVIAVDITDLMKEKENAQAAAKAKSDFLSRMSHEMRTPMNAIIGMTKIAENTNDSSKLKYCLSVIGNSSRLLLGIINDVLDMSKIEAGKFELENVPMNIQKMLSKICDMVNENMKKKELDFNVILPEDMELNYNADELRISQVITNLLSNAAKFTEEKGKVTLKAEEIERQGESSTLHFLVSDTGIGMTEEQIGRLFNSFEQADGSITRRFGGTGLGLAISKRIIEKMGGNIWVESEHGAGSTFHFNVKLERLSNHETEENEAGPPEVPDLQGLNILLAEDVEINREILLALLEETRVSIDTAENGMLAVSKFRENPEKYDLILMDIQMPDMDGYQATKTIRGLDIPHAKSVPIIALTANAFKEDIARCLDSGMNDHLSKPIDEKAVIEKILLHSGRGE